MRERGRWDTSAKGQWNYPQQNYPKLNFKSCRREKVAKQQLLQRLTRQLCLAPQPGDQQFACWGEAHLAWSHFQAVQGPCASCSHPRCSPV